MQAWLSLTPAGNEQTNSKIYGGKLPEIPVEWSHLPVFLGEIGIAGEGGENLTPLTFGEIGAWANLMRVVLSPFEAECLRLMSKCYTGIANNPKSECPVETVEVRQKISETNAAAWLSLGTEK